MLNLFILFFVPIRNARPLNVGTLGIVVGQWNVIVSQRHFNSWFYYYEWLFARFDNIRLIFCTALRYLSELIVISTEKRNINPWKMVLVVVPWNKYEEKQSTFDSSHEVEWVIEIRLLFIDLFIRFQKMTYQLCRLFRFLLCFYCINVNINVDWKCTDSSILRNPFTNIHLNGEFGFGSRTASWSINYHSVGRHILVNIFVGYSHKFSATRMSGTVPNS